MKAIVKTKMAAGAELLPGKIRKSRQKIGNIKIKVIKLSLQVR